MVGLCSGTACQRVAEPSLASVTVIVQELWENTRRGRAHLPRLGSGLVLDGGLTVPLEVLGYIRGDVALAESF